jgi:zinc D-Ala-D-Ala carboxypeptidase
LSLSAHFSWDEASKSSTASVRGIDNSIPETLKANVIRTAGHMEEVRALLGGTPLRVTSWYRSRELNKAIGGSRTSAHMRGLAVDFKPPAGMTLYAAFETIAKSSIPFDQLIEERTRDGAWWIHIGFSEGTPRREVLRAEGYKLGGPMVYRRIKVS